MRIITIIIPSIIIIIMWDKLQLLINAKVELDYQILLFISLFTVAIIVNWYNIADLLFSKKIDK